MIRVVYDLSPVTADPAHRAGLARVTLRTAELLVADPGVSVRFSSIGSVHSLVWSAKVLAGLSGAVPALPPTRFAERVVGLEAALCVSGGRAAKCGRAAIRAGLSAWNQVRTPVPAGDLRWAELFHSSYARVPSAIRRHKHLGVVVTVHDLTPLVAPPALFPPHQLGVTRRIIASIRKTDWVIAVSHATRSDFLAQSGHPSDRCSVVHWAADPAMFHPCPNPELVAKVRAKYGLPLGRYVLSLSSLAPHKNVAHLARCVARVADRPGCGDVSLVLAGGQGERSREWLADLGPAGKRVHFAGYVAEPDLAPLYTGAAAFAFPSIYEGFGLPVLEAMQCGAAVVTSNSSSLPEVVGVAGLLAPPTDKGAWVDALSRLLTDNALRTRLSVAGLERAAAFTWERTLRETLDVYNRAKQVGRK